MLGVGDVAGDRDDLGELGQLGARGLERVGAAGVDDEAPRAPRELARQGEAEAARGAGDECRVHADHARRASGRATIGLWS